MQAYLRCHAPNINNFSKDVSKFKYKEVHYRNDKTLIAHILPIILV